MFQNVDEMSKNSSFASAKARLQMNDGIKTPDAVLQKAGERVQVDFDAVVWKRGDKFTIPSQDVLYASLYGQRIGSGSNYSCGVLVHTDSNEVKQLPFSIFKKSVSPYCFDPTKGGYIRTPNTNPIQSNTRLSQDLRLCVTEKDIYDFLVSNSGKTIEVVDVLQCETSRQDWSVASRPIIGLRPATVPCFEWSN